MGVIRPSIAGPVMIAVTKLHHCRIGEQHLSRMPRAMYHPAPYVINTLRYRSRYLCGRYGDRYLFVLALVVLGKRIADVPVSNVVCDEKLLRIDQRGTRGSAVQTDRVVFIERRGDSHLEERRNCGLDEPMHLCV